MTNVVLESNRRATFETGLFLVAAVDQVTKVVTIHKVIGLVVDNLCFSGETAQSSRGTPQDGR